jgi:hypothetical protein
MLQRTLLGASLKRGWTDPIHDADLLLVDLDLLHQSPNDFPWPVSSIGTENRRKPQNRPVSDRVYPYWQVFVALEIAVFAMSARTALAKTLFDIETKETRSVVAHGTRTGDGCMAAFQLAIYSRERFANQPLPRK